ncbi:MAG TPA: MFS transporter [Polyangiaceae bacterium]|nr:MFS transporter [Polyangiaceae bacterium]
MQPALLAVPFLDELGSGLPVVGAPALEQELFGTLTALGFAVFTAPQLISFLLEPPLLVFLGRFARAHRIRFGLVGYGLSLLIAALSHSALLFGLGLTVAFILSGVACSNAQAALVERDLEHGERVLAEWTLAGALGDLAAPLLVGAPLLLGCGFRAAWVVAALLFLVCGFIAGRGARAAVPEKTRSDPTGVAEADDDEKRVSFGELWRTARQTPGLLAWLTGATLCSLMDETLVAFCAVWMKQRFATESAATLGVFTLMLGGFLGLIALHRLLLWVEPRALLLAACLGSSLALASFLAAGSPWLAAFALGCLGACAATHYPLAQAAAYRTLPNGAGSVALLGQLFGPLDLAIPVVLGFAADRWGLAAALIGLLVQPVGLLAALTSSRRHRQTTNKSEETLPGSEPE